MPKLQRSIDQVKQSYMTGVIKKYQEVQSMSTSQLARRMGLAESTMRQHIREPDKITVAEQRELFRILKVPGGEILQCYIITGKEDTA